MTSPLVCGDLTAEELTLLRWMRDTEGDMFTLSDRDATTVYGLCDKGLCTRDFAYYAELTPKGREAIEAIQGGRGD